MWGRHGIYVSTFAKYEIWSLYEDNKPKCSGTQIPWGDVVLNGNFHQWREEIWETPQSLVWFLDCKYWFFYILYCILLSSFFTHLLNTLQVLYVSSLAPNLYLSLPLTLSSSLHSPCSLPSHEVTSVTRSLIPQFYRFLLQTPKNSTFSLAPKPTPLTLPVLAIISWNSVRTGRCVIRVLIPCFTKLVARHRNVQGEGVGRVISAGVYFMLRA
jgi:hypothetical protein